MTTFEINAGNIYRIIGPISIRVLNGEIFIAGFTAGKGFKLVLKGGKSLAFKAQSQGLLKVSVGKDGSIARVPAVEEVIDDWLEISDCIISKVSTGSKVVVLGDVDSGKTSFATFLANRALQVGIKVAVLDADIGQADIGPPSTISLSLLERNVVSLRECYPDALYFLGFDAPMYAPEKIISGILKLLGEMGERWEIAVINTDGWIRGIRAQIYKRSLVEAVNPDFIVVMKPADNSSIKRILFNYDVIEAPSPKVYVKKTQNMRRSFRESGYLKYLRDSSVITLDMKRITLLNTFLFQGDCLEKEKEIIEKMLGTSVFYCEKSENEIFIVVDDVARLNKAGINLLKIALRHLGSVKIVKRGDEENILVGLLDDRGLCIGIGLIRKMDYNNRKIWIFTPASKDRVKAISLGLIKVDSKGREIHKSPYRYL